MKKIDADAAAYATKVKAEAEAEANQKIAASLTESLIKWQQANAWDGKLPTYMAGEGSTSLPILDLK